MILTNSCKEKFLESHIIAWFFLPNRILNLVILRWFNTQTNIGIDIQNWELDGFDYGVFDPFNGKVYQSNEKAGMRNKNFDKVLEQAIKKANSVYNGICYN